MFQEAKITKYTLLVLTLFTPSVIAVCPENCNSCDEQDRCTSCKTGYWDLASSCQFKCSGNCLSNDCDTNGGSCVACKLGLYGIQCQHDCSICDGGLCGSRSCTNGCKAGYFEYQDTVDNLCFSCSLNCKSCSNATACNFCKDGFYLFKYISFGKVTAVCVQCQDVTGCSNCEIQNCKQCQIQVDSSLLCTQCKEGYRYNGQICISNESTCAQGCSTDCDEKGICQGSCNTGWTGDRCSDQCAIQCLKCDKTNANICEECKSDYYTVTCDVGCDQSCIKEVDKKTCRQSDGYCNNGCANTFWGRYCNQSCSYNCADDRLSRMCDRGNGTCTHGCADGFRGAKCETTVLTTSTMKTTGTPTSVQCPNAENTDTRTSVITGYMSGVGTAVFIVLIITVLYHLRRRYIANKSKSYNEGNATVETSTYYNENATETREPEIQLSIDANNYESLASNRNTDKVYSELESQAEQQGHSYYNIDDSN